MVSESILINVLGILFAIFGALFIIVKIFPRIGDLLMSVFDNERIVSNLMTLLILLVYILLFVGVVNLIKNIDNQYLNYISVLDPGINLILAILPYMKWLVFAIALGLSFRYIKRK